MTALPSFTIYRTTSLLISLEETTRRASVPPTIRKRRLSGTHETIDWQSDEHTGTVLARDMRLRKLFHNAGRGLLAQCLTYSSGCQRERRQSSAAIRECCLVS
jgi:hypothetical protein